MRYLRSRLLFTTAVLGTVTFFSNYSSFAKGTNPLNHEDVIDSPLLTQSGSPDPAILQERLRLLQQEIRCIPSQEDADILEAQRVMLELALELRMVTGEGLADTEKSITAFEAFVDKNLSQQGDLCPSS
jgi:hypothetical protein